MSTRPSVRAADVEFTVRYYCLVAERSYNSDLPERRAVATNGPFGFQIARRRDPAAPQLGAPSGLIPPGTHYPLRPSARNVLGRRLRNSINANIAVAQAAGGGIAIGGLDLVQSVIVSQNQMLQTLNEIERQANVGIGYAFSAKHVLAEPCLQNA
jgi:hypothetical protein